MIRITRWEQALFAETAKAASRPHVWGSHDCVIFAADCVLAMTGEDLMAGLRETYDSPISAARVIRAQGVDNLGDLAGLYLPEVHISEARRGDLILSAEPYDFLAVCVGITAVGPSEHGMIHIPIAQALRAFRVGE